MGKLCTMHSKNATRILRLRETAPVDLAARRANLLGALVLTLSDRIRYATEGVLGLAGEAAAALLTIAQQPGGTVEDLRVAVGRSQPATVRIVDRLVELGLVERRPSGRGPAVALHATAAGAGRARELLAARRQALDELVPDLSDEEVETLTRVVERALRRAAQLPAGVTVCRLCDKGRCRRIDCPVVAELAAQGVDLPPPTEV